VNAYLVDRRGAPSEAVDAATVTDRLESGEFFWLDLHAPGADELVLLRDVFRFHPLAVEDSEHFGQRPKLEDYGDFVFIVLYGAAPAPDEDRLVEVHCFYSAAYLVTVRKDESPACHAVRKRYERPGAAPERPAVVLYRLLDALVDSFFPALADVDDTLERLETQLLERPDGTSLPNVLALRRRLAHLRGVVAPQRQLAGQLAAGLLDLPALDDDGRRYFRDVHDHLIRIGEQIDVQRDLLTGALDVYLSSSSNRLNEVVKQLTLIATIFLPLTFVTGFFGQNFGWMVDHVGGWPQFVVLGIGLEVLAAAGLLVLFRRRGWF
jgi:magnesium transporter